MTRTSVFAFACLVGMASGCTALVDGTLSGRGTDAGPGGMDSGPLPDTGPLPDSGPLADTGPVPDSGPSSPCNGMPDGIHCTIAGIDEPFVCIDGICQISRCGDGANDARVGSMHTAEVCDDGNDVDGDGCDTDCTFSCATSSECDDTQFCNGSETCNTMHVCEPGTNQTDLTPCVLMGGSGVTTCHEGVCRAGVCPDGHVDSGEECDPATPTANDGCEDDCTFTCAADSDCQDSNLCNGTETCDLANHVCVAATDALVCDDADMCTDDACDMATGCVFTSRLVDADHDMHSAPLTGCGGDDCDDTDPTRYPGAPEACGGSVDNNCDGSMGMPSNWYRDCDGDGFALAGATATASCTMPSTTASCVSWTQTAPTTLHTNQDCLDTSVGGSTHPGQGAYYTTSVSGQAPAYDYNCSGTATLDQSRSTSVTVPPNTRISAACAAAGHSLCTGETWYVGSASPACGASATESYCFYNLLTHVCSRTSHTVTAACH